MEDARIDAPKLLKSKLLFPPHRRSHLRSETYCTLVRIFSPFCESADVSLATEFDPQQLRAAHSSHLRQATVESLGQQVGEDFVRQEIGDSANEKVTVVEDGLGMKSLEDGRFHDSEVKMDVIEDLVMVGRSDNLSDERELLGASSQDNHCIHEESCRDELEAEHMVEANKVLDNNSGNKTRTSDQTNCRNDQISPKIFPEEIVEHQQVMDEEDVVNIVQKLSVNIFLLDGDKVGEASKRKEDNQENMLPIVDKAVHQGIENQPKKSKSEGIVCEPDLEVERSHVSSSEVMEVEVGEQCSEKVSGVDLSYMDREMPFRADERSKNCKDRAISMEVDASEVELKMVSEDIQMDKCLIESEDIEEGEICGDSTYEILEYSAALDEKVVDNEISKGTMNRNMLSPIQANGEARKPDTLFSDIIEYATHENREESKQNKSSLDAYKHGSIVSVKMATNTIEDQNDFMLEEAGYTVKDSGPKKGVDSFTTCVSNQVLHGQVLSERATRREEIISTDKETGAWNKKKRGPLSEARKEKKKVQKRKKRAEKNRKPGVKRLKLHPVSVPKPVVYCRHYIKGRCQEADKCKFSHDTIPVTKSTPCGYFARHSCMKGDDCPFDHQLFKYPCSNFVSKGSCPRGDTCMFSHKILPQEQSSTPNLKTESKPPVIPDILDSQNKSNMSGGIKQKIVTVPNNAGGSLPEKTMGSLPSGISFLSFGKSPGHSSQVKNDAGECRNFLARSGLCSVDNSNKNSRKIQPGTAPKGINFLSVGRNSPKSNSEQVATPSSYNDSTIPSDNQTRVGNDFSELLDKVQTTTPKAMNKGTPNSAHKALLSTLAFAAKYESMDKCKSIASTGSNDGNKEDKNGNISGSLKNDQAKASKLLDFLLGIGSKSNLK